MSLVRIPVKCCADTDEVVNTYCFVHWVRGTTRQSVTRLLVIWLGVWWSQRCSHLPNRLHARKSLWGCRRVVGETRGPGYVLQHACDQTRPELDECSQTSTWISRPAPSGTRSLCELRPSWQLGGQILTCFACILDFHRSCNQQLETLLDSRCAAEACLRRKCRPHQSMPTLPSCMQDTGCFSCVCRIIFSESCLQVAFRTHTVSTRKESEKKKSRQAHLINIVLFPTITKTKEDIMVFLALSVPLTLFNLCLLLNSHCRPYV